MPFRFHRLKNCEPNTSETFRFTRLVFGLTQSPFILEATLKRHFENCKSLYQNLIETIERDNYVDDLITGGSTADQVNEIKGNAINLFEQGGFTLHKWHSNISHLESQSKPQDKTSYAKQILETKPNETKVLGIEWNKGKDQYVLKAADFTENQVIKRTILKYIASIYDPLGIISPAHVIGKSIYRDICEAKVAWDKEIPSPLKKKFESCVKDLAANSISFPRPITGLREDISSVELHVFRDASIIACCAAVYAIVRQRNRTSQHLVASKSRLSKRTVTISRLELIAATMAANLVDNVKRALPLFHISGVYCWSDSTVVLYWLQKRGDLKLFVHNRVEKILAKCQDWRYVPTKENPADIGSRGCIASKLPESWWMGPDWLSDSMHWPEQPEIKSNNYTQLEMKPIKEIIATTICSCYQFEEILQKHRFWKALRIASWIFRFIHNCMRTKRAGPLTTAEIENARKYIIKKEQIKFEDTPEFEKDKETLNLKRDEEGIYRCYGRVQHLYPTYLPTYSLLANKVIEAAHTKTLHGGVTITMSEIRRTYWIPTLRKLTKSVVRKCYGCKRHRVSPIALPQEGLLPTDRTEPAFPLEVIGTDYAGPLYYKGKNKSSQKCYILLFSCCVTRAVHLTLVPNLTVDYFIKSLRNFISRRGKPSIIYSDNAKTFKAGAKLISKIKNSKEFHNFLNKQNIIWKFNVPRAPWWGGHYEMLIGLVKQTLYRTVGNKFQTWTELKDVLMEIEINLNNRPLTYVEDDVEGIILSPNSMILGRDVELPAEKPITEEKKNGSNVSSTFKDVKTLHGKDGNRITSLH